MYNVLGFLDLLPLVQLILVTSYIHSVSNPALLTFPLKQAFMDSPVARYATGTTQQSACLHLILIQAKCISPHSGPCTRVTECVCPLFSPLFLCSTFVTGGLDLQTYKGTAYNAAAAGCILMCCCNYMLIVFVGVGAAGSIELNRPQTAEQRYSPSNF